MRLKHLVSLALLTTGIGITASVSADTFPEGYVCQVDDYGGTEGFSLTSGKNCGGNWLGWWYLTSSNSPAYPGQFDRLQRAMYAQYSVQVQINASNSPVCFFYWAN
jgi:hypothetical protein